MIIIYNGVSMEVASAEKKQSIMNVLFEAHEQKVERIKRAYRKRITRRPYTAEENERIWKMFTVDNRRIKAIAKDVGRTYAAVSAQLVVLRKAHNAGETAGL